MQSTILASTPLPQSPSHRGSRASSTLIRVDESQEKAESKLSTCVVEQKKSASTFASSELSRWGQILNPTHLADELLQSVTSSSMPGE